MGNHDVAYVAYDEAGNTAQCHFKIYVLNRYVFIHYLKYFCGRFLTIFDKIWYFYIILPLWLLFDCIWPFRGDY